MASTKSNVADRHDASSDQIRDDIRDTRSEMDETLDELGTRLHPRKVLDEILGLFAPSEGSEGPSTASEVGTRLKQGGKSVARYARENPVPSLLMAAGVAWAIYDAASDDDAHDEPIYRRPTRRDLAYRNLGAGAALDDEALTPPHSEFWDEGPDSDDPSMIDRAKAGLETAGEAISDAASSVAGSVSAGASSAASAGSQAWRSTQRASRAGYRKSGQLGRAAQRQAGHAVDRTREGVEVAKQRFDEASDAYPLAVAGGFIAAGLLAGLLLPRTRMEDEWIGEYADDAKQEAMHRGEQAYAAGKERLAETASSAMDEAEAQGLTPNELAEKAKRVAAKTGQAAKRAAEQENVDPQSLKQKSAKVGEQAKQDAAGKKSSATSERFNS